MVGIVTGIDVQFNSQFENGFYENQRPPIREPSKDVQRPQSRKITTISGKVLVSKVRT